MNISEVEKQTGITKQNIRFYEKEGLIEPRRNENGYREYTKEEIRRLKLIYVLRKMGISIPKIKEVFDGACTLTAAVAMRQEQLMLERERQEELLSFCREIKTQTLNLIDVDKYKERIDTEERKGNKFGELLNDYKEIYRSEQRKKFAIIPDELVTNGKEFTNALLAYAKDQNKDITIIKEGLYPEFVLDGIEYTAYRINGRHGTKIYCEMKYPGLVDPVGIDDRRKYILQGMAKYLPQFLLLLILLLFILGSSGIWNGFHIALIGILVVLFLASIIYPRI